MSVIGSDWTKKKKLTIASSKVSASETSITCFISVTDTDFKDEAKSDGADFRIATGDETTQLPFAVIEYDDSTGNLVAAFEADSISSSTDTDFYLYYGNSSATMPEGDSTYGSEAAFDNSYEGAYFTLDNVTIHDKTSNGRDMTTVDHQPYLLNTTFTGGPTAEQGCCFDGSNYYFISTNYLYKRSSVSGSNLATNSDPCGDVNTELSISSDHCGGGCVYDGYLYIPVEAYSVCPTVTSQAIARFNVSDLSLDSAWDITAQGDECSGIAIDSEAGTNGVIYITSYCGDTIEKYDLATPTIHLGTITLTNSNETEKQGIAIRDDGNFIIFSVNFVTLYSSSGVFIELLAKQTRIGAYSEGEAGFIIGDDVYWWFHDNVLRKISPIGDVYTSTIGGAFFKGYGYEEYIELAYTLPTVGSIQTFITPTEYFNYSTIWDNSGDGNQWEGWCYSDGRLAQRIGSSRIYDLDSLGTVSDKYLTTFGWTQDGSNVDTANMVNGVSRDSGTESWDAPGTTFYLSGGNASNDGGKHEYYAMFLRNIDLGKDADLALTEYNNISSPSTFITFGSEENNSANPKVSGVDWSKMYGVSDPAKINGVD